MEPAQFIEMCKRLFGRDPKGYGWQAEMYRKTGTPLRTIQAWASGENPIPAIVAALLVMLVEERAVRMKVGSYA